MQAAQKNHGPIDSIVHHQQNALFPANVQVLQQACKAAGKFGQFAIGEFASVVDIGCF